MSPPICAKRDLADSNIRIEFKVYTPKGDWMRSFLSQKHHPFERKESESASLKERICRNQHAEIQFAHLPGDIIALRNITVIPLDRGCDDMRGCDQ